jgi:hypothetical protein
MQRAAPAAGTPVHSTVIRRVDRDLKMPSPSSWLAASVAAGASLGIALGYALSAWSWGGPAAWLLARSADAIGWGVIGAAATGAAAVGLLRLVRPRTRTSARPAALKARTRTQPPAHVEAANLNARLARAS